jgi:hypothetical protein
MEGRSILPEHVLVMMENCRMLRTSCLLTSVSQLQLVVVMGKRPETTCQPTITKELPPTFPSLNLWSLISNCADDFAFERLVSHFPSINNFPASARAMHLQTHRQSKRAFARNVSAWRFKSQLTVCAAVAGRCAKPYAWVRQNLRSMNA